MKNKMQNSLKRILAVAMALFVVLGSIPLPMVTYATEIEGEQTGNNVAVSVTVTDDNEETPGAIAGATVKYAFTAADVEETGLDGVEWTDVAGATDENGVLTVIAENTVTVDETNAKLWVRASKDGYGTETVSIDMTVLTEAQELEIVLEEAEQQQQSNTVDITVVGMVEGTTVQVAGEEVALDENGIGSSDVNASSDVAYSIDPGDGYYIKSVKVNGEDVDISELAVGDTYTGKLDASVADVTLTVELDECYTVNVVAETASATEGAVGGKVTLNNEATNTLTVTKDKKVNGVISAETDYIILDFMVDGVSQEITDDKEVTFEATAETEIKVTFIRVYKITFVYDEESGNVKVEETALGGKVYTQQYDITKDVITIVAEPEDGYRVVKVEIDQEAPIEYTDNDASYTGEVSANVDHTVTITFALNGYEITTSQTGEGTIAVSAENGKVPFGGETTVTITPAVGFTVAEDGIVVKGSESNEEKNVTIDEKNADGTFSFKITGVEEAKEVVVTFVEIAPAIESDYTVDRTGDLRTENNFYLINEGGKIIFKTDKAGIKVYKNVDGNDVLIGGNETSNTVDVSETAQINKIEVYYKASGEMDEEWHKIDVNEQVVVDDTGAEIINEKINNEEFTSSVNENYYNSDITITFTATDRDVYSGIASIEYYITKTSEEYEKDASAYNPNNGSDRTVLYEYTDGEIKQSVSLEEIGTQIVVDATEYNSQYTRVWVKVTDRAGVSTYKTFELPINTEKPTVSLSIDGEKNDGITDAYYKSERVITFTIVDRADTFIAKADTDKNVSLKFVIEKDGEEFTINGNDITWQEEDTNAPNVHVGTYTLSEEGNYQINGASLKYTNKAGLGNDGVTIINEVSAELASFIIDKTRPSVSGVEFLENLTLEKDEIKYYHTNSTVTAFIKASDAISGIAEVTWRYEKTVDVSEVNKDSEEDSEFKTAPFNVEKGGYEVQIPLTKNQETGEYEQLHGHLVIQVVDKAGHTLEAYYDDSKQIFVIDTKNPIMTVAHTASNNENGQNIYDGDIMFTFTVNEANFYAEDVKVTITKDDGKTNEVTAVKPEWKSTSTDEHVGTYVISGDGKYSLTVEYTDKSGNVMKYVDENGDEISTTYTIDNLIIDTTAPSIDFSSTNEQMVITIIERNFDSEAIVIDGDSTIKDIIGKNASLSVATLQAMLQNSENWAQDEEKPDVHTCTLLMDASFDGIYNLKINYKDIVGKDAVISPEEFTIDHTAPSNVSFEYYGNDLLGRLLEKITFGYFREEVTVVLTAEDSISGVSAFDWKYTREEGASENILESASGSITEGIVQDDENPKKFTVSFTMSKDDATQLRGNFAALARDAYDNESQMVTDEGNVIVVDDIKPEMFEVTYSPADRIEGATAYYESDTVDVEFKVTEANFYAEDVKVKVSKDGGAAYDVTTQWNNIGEDKYEGTFKLSGDGDYIVTVHYTDRSANEMASYQSHVITIDTVAPIIDVKYANTNAINTLADRDGNQRKYFADTQTATITVKEHNFKAEEVVLDIKAMDVAGNELNAAELCNISTWSAGTEADTHVLTITYLGDANYTFDIAYSDIATNPAADYAPDYFTVDKTAPTDLKVSYSTSILETVLEFITFGFYNAKADVTIVADDITSGVNGFVYSYTNAEGVSNTNAELINQAISAADITYSNNGRTATAKFQIPKDVLVNENQFNGTVSFEAIDRAGLKTSLADSKRIVVDNIAPTAQVTYNEPVNTEGSISYYNGNVNATVVITEANFYAEDVSVTVSRDGGASYAVTPSWTNNSVDIHTGTFTLTEDGDYFITINYRDKSTNQMVEYRSEQLTIDTDIVAPVITFNGNAENGQAYKEDVVPEISFTDKNYDSFEVFLYRTNMDEIEVNITEEKGINNLFSVSDEDGSASLDVFAKDENGNYDQNDDGIYHLVVSIKDKAGHTEKAEAYFTINRYGSVYKFNDYLVGLISEGGSYVTAVTEDLVITEYNADQLVADSLDIEITRDGKPLESVDYTVSPTINETVGVGESGWYQYEYVIKKDNFAIDGTYKISISSKDKTGNNPENSNYEDKNILFYVDSTVPEITSITGLDKAVVDDTELTVTYTVFDAIGLKSVKVYVDDEILNEVTDFSADFNNYEGSFTLEESEKERTIRIVVEDMAGNITDTSSDEFTSAYAFNSAVTVTTNAWVRFMANKPLFYGTIGGVVVLAGAASVVIGARLKKKAK